MSPRRRHLFFPLLSSRQVFSKRVFFSVTRDELLLGCQKKVQKRQKKAFFSLLSLSLSLTLFFPQKPREGGRGASRDERARKKVREQRQPLLRRRKRERWYEERPFSENQILTRPFFSLSFLRERVNARAFSSFSFSVPKEQPPEFFSPLSKISLSLTLTSDAKLSLSVVFLNAKTDDAAG